ncbi:MAG: bifunctional glutamate N-acetyltransferase/amino-acid acetyltransferase ArgJ, partial [Syntrophales bacterium]|nr:bifunctional glutamate N-acetyltransferase/amino-acid acetyltransferase ArgJ [Syntrophales bacterium]
MTDKGENISVPGFLANGIHVGIKTTKNRDLSLIFSTRPAKAAGVFTTNCFKAAPVLVSMDRIGKGTAQAIITNSGNANAATGDKGYEDAVMMARGAARRLRIEEDMVLVSSTGVIGHNLPLPKILSGMDRLVDGLSPDGVMKAEEGIMTTDKFPKVAFRKVAIDGRDISICGLAKGAGMIQPNMATLLTYVITDAQFSAGSLEKVFKYSVDRTFNAISVDGCMSTNDTALILANGMAGNRPIKAGSQAYGRFREALMEVMETLAVSIVRDGEGATKVIEILVDQAASVQEAKKIAYAVANANLVKAAFFGKDPNWGRIISAAGAIGISLPVNDVKLYLEDALIFGNGQGVPGDEDHIR